MYYTVYFGIPYFLIFYQSKPFKYLKNAKKHYAKLCSMVSDSLCSKCGICVSLDKKVDLSFNSLLKNASFLDT